MKVFIYYRKTVWTASFSYIVNSIIIVVLCVWCISQRVYELDINISNVQNCDLIISMIRFMINANKDFSQDFIDELINPLWNGYMDPVWLPLTNEWKFDEMISNSKLTSIKYKKK